MTTVTEALVEGGFDSVRSRDVRFLEEAAKIGKVTVHLWRDDASGWCTAPVFPYRERAYVLKAVKFVGRVVEDVEGLQACILIDREADASVLREKAAHDRNLKYRVIAESQLAGFPTATTPPRGDKTVVVTGCFDWLHSGHVRFFEEASRFGELTVFIGNDATLAELKGPGHPQFPQDERRYLVNAIRHVHHAQVATGSGWLDAEAEIRALKPDFFVVNEDGDKECKRGFCRELEIEYRVLKREPAEGLPERSSTALRGF